MEFLLSDKPDENSLPIKKNEDMILFKVLTGENPDSILNKGLQIRLVSSDEKFSVKSEKMMCTTKYSPFSIPFKVSIDDFNISSTLNQKLRVEFHNYDNSDEVLAISEYFNILPLDILNSNNYTSVHTNLLDPTNEKAIGNINLKISSCQFDNSIKFNINLQENDKVMINKQINDEDGKTEYLFMSNECYKLCSREKAEKIFGTSSDDDEDSNNSIASFSSSMLSPMHTPIREINSILGDDDRTERSIDIFFERKIMSGLGRINTEPYFDLGGESNQLNLRSMSQAKFSPLTTIYSPIKKSPSIDSLIEQGSISIIKSINLSTDSDEEHELSFA